MQIHESLDKVKLPEAKIIKRDQLKSLSSLKNAIKVSEKNSIS